MSIHYNSKIVTDGLVLCLDAGNSKSYNQAENLLTYSAATTANWTTVTSNTTVANLSLNALGLFNGVLVTSNLGYNWHRIETGQVFSITSGETYTLTFYYRSGSSGYARLQIRCNSLESFVEGLANGSSWTPQSDVGTVSNISTVLMSDGLTYRTCYTIVASQTGAASLGIGIGLGDNIAGKTIIALGGQVTKKIGPSKYTATTGTAVTAATTWKDLLSSSTFTLANAPLYNSSGNGSLTFNGSTQETQLLNTNYPTNALDPFSVETTIYVPSDATWSNTYYGNILTRGSYAGSHGLFRHSTNNVITMYVRQNNPYAATEALATITRDTWYHVIGTWDGYYPKIYVNGSLVSTGYLMASSTTYTSDTWCIGAVKAAGGADGNRFKGNVGSAKVYNKALSAIEVQNNFNAQRGRYGL